MFSDLSTTAIVFVLVSLVISIIVHELMHGVMAYWLGDRTAADAGRLTLNPLASIDPVGTIFIPFIAIVYLHTLFLAAKPVPFNPENVKWGDYGAALVGLAGPASNFVLALVGAVLYNISDSGTFAEFAVIFTSINIGIMVFNLLPIPPLDGSRVLYAFAPDSVRRVMEQIEATGFVVMIAIFFLAAYVLSPVIISIQQTILQILLR